MSILAQLCLNVPESDIGQKRPPFNKGGCFYKRDPNCVISLSFLTNHIVTQFLPFEAGPCVVREKGVSPGVWSTGSSYTCEVHLHATIFGKYDVTCWPNEITLESDYGQ